MALCLRQKKDSNVVINRLCIKLVEKSRLCVPLYHMIPLSLVRPINKVDVERFKNEFVINYLDGDRATYVSIFNNHGHMVDVTDHLPSSSNVLRRKANKSFDAFLAADNDLASMVGKLFFVWER